MGLNYESAADIGFPSFECTLGSCDSEEVVFSPGEGLGFLSDLWELLSTVALIFAWLLVNLSFGILDWNFSLSPPSVESLLEGFAILSL